MNLVKKIALGLLVIGGLNWGLVGFFDFNLVAFLFDGITPVISRIIYALVGIASVTTLISWILPVTDDEYSYNKGLTD